MDLSLIMISSMTDIQENTISQRKLSTIEKLAKKISSKNQKFLRLIVTEEEALELKQTLSRWQLSLLRLPTVRASPVTKMVSSLICALASCIQILQVDRQCQKI